MHKAFGILGSVAIVLLTSCGGGGGSTSRVSGTPTGGGGTTNPSGSVVTPTTVTVGPGQTTQGVDVAVPAVSPVLNAQVLGIVDLSANGGSASNTGGTIARGTSGRVLMFGTGLNGSLQISVSGPNDVTVSNPQSIKATDGTPGVSFTIAVSGTATPGARTVVLRDSKDNISTFTGGLEIR